MVIEITVEHNSEWLSVNRSCEECAPVAAVVEFNTELRGGSGIVKLGS